MLYQRIKNTFSSFAIILLLWALTGCAETAPTTHYYFMESPSHSLYKQGKPTKYPALMLFKKVSSMSPYNTVNFAVKIRPSEVKFYNYAKWVSPPHELLYHYFLKSLTFSQLIELAASSIGQKDVYHLEMEIQEFGQKLEKNRPYAGISLFVGIRHARSKTYSWYTIYHHQEPSQSEQPYHVVVALNKTVETINQKLLKDLDTFFAAEYSK
ncbi:MAG: membrane integrity-associated transporter subunit PqiC [SAR324 cluster bacterium]|nr:membrane integrity-associated transporter subunit PqiC [SAR324 cluster bacterium]